MVMIVRPSSSTANATVDVSGMATGFGRLRPTRKTRLTPVRAPFWRTTVPSAKSTPAGNTSFATPRFPTGSAVTTAPWLASTTRTAASHCRPARP